MIPRAVWIAAAVPISLEHSVSRKAPGLALLIKGERKMKTTILTLAGSALIALSAVQFATASEHHRGKMHHRANTEFRNSNAYAAPASVAIQPEWSYRYNRGYSDLAGH